MGFGMGINALLYAAEEASYGVTPASGFKKLPFVSHSLGEEIPLIEDDQLGFGRQGQDPSYDAAVNDGDITVPVDVGGFGFWLKGLFGAPATTGSGTYTHVFTPGSTIPSRSIEIGHPDVPAYSVHYGASLNQMRIAAARSGSLNAVLSMICQGETTPQATSVAGTPSALNGPRFAQASGLIKRDGTALGNVVSVDLSISNGLEKIEVMRGDKGRIGGVAPGPFMVTARIRTRFDSYALLTEAQNGSPINIDELGWSNGTASLKFAMPRVFLPKPKRQVEGPRGIMADFDCQASGRMAAKITATLINGQATY